MAARVLALSALLPDPVVANMPPAITVWIHSYKSDMAGVVWIKVVMGGSSFLVRRGSNGVRAANYGRRNSKVVSLGCYIVLNFHVKCPWTYQLNDLDKHPVVGRRCQKFEQLRSKRKVVLWVASGQFANDVHGSRDHSYTIEFVGVSYVSTLLFMQGAKIATRKTYKGQDPPSAPSSVRN